MWLRISPSKLSRGDGVNGAVLRVVMVVRIWSSKSLSLRLRVFVVLKGDF